MRLPGFVRSRIAPLSRLRPIIYRLDRGDLFVSQPDISDDLSFEIPNTSIVEVPTLAFDPSIVELPPVEQQAADISDDLFKPIEGITTGGKVYDTGGRALDAEQELKRREPGVTLQASPYRKAYAVAKGEGGEIYQRQSIWDMLLPLLQPPLEFDFPRLLDLPHDLYDFQRPGIEFLIERECALLGDEMGTGKTVMATVALRILFQTGKASSALIVCPLSVLSVWDQHLREWAPMLSVTVVRGSQPERRRDWKSPAHVYLTTYDTLRQDMSSDGAEPRAKTEFDVVILDEIQAIKNWESRRSRAVRKLRARYRWGLSGTPIENRLDDLFAIFGFLDPEVFPRSELRTISPQEAKARLQPYFLRREKRQVMKDLPPKIRQEEWLELDSDQKAEYEAALAEGRERIAASGEEISKVHIFQLIHRLKQICNFASNKDKSTKSAAVRELVEQIVDGGRKVLVFSQYKEYGIDKLQPVLDEFGVVRFSGEMSQSAREQAVTSFRTDPSKHVFLATVKTGGLGLTLTEASYVIHFDHWWNPAVMWQAEDRTHRPGQTEPVNVYSLWMRDTIDERIHDILERKGLLHEEVIGALSREVVDSLISTEEWLEVLGLESKRKPREVTEITPQHLLTMDPTDFEYVIKDLFVHLGYTNATVTRKTQDGGIDIQASRDRPGGKELIVVQCKRYSDPVGIEHARNLLGVVNDNPAISKGFLVAAGEISREARRFCERNGQLAYLDGTEVARYLNQFRRTENQG